MKWRGYYVLDGHMPVPIGDPLTWACWMEQSERHVAETTIGPLRISTVFLGLDHNLLGPGEPVLFETMIFGFDESDSYLTRCCTWDEAVRMHAMATDIAETLVQVANVTLAAFGHEMTIRLRATALPDDTSTG